MLVTIRLCSVNDTEKNPELKDGQNIQRNNVPSIAIVVFKYVFYGALVGLIFEERMRLTAKPK